MAQWPGSPGEVTTRIVRGGQQRSLDGRRDEDDAPSAWFSSWDDPGTEVIAGADQPAAPAAPPPPVPAAPARAASTTTTVRPWVPPVAAPPTAATPPPPPDAEPRREEPPPPAEPPLLAPEAVPEPDDAGRAYRSKQRMLMVTVAFGILLGLYVADLLSGLGTVPRGVTVAHVPVGGLSYAEAEQRLRQILEPRSAQPVPVRAGEVSTTLEPKVAGLSLDWPATVNQAATQPLNPLTRLMSLFTPREVGVVTRSDSEKLTSALGQLQPVVDRPVVEGDVRFEGLRPVPVDPAAGHALDVGAAEATLVRDWVNGETVQLPTTVLAPTTTAEAVRVALEQVATPAVSAPVTLVGEGKQATIAPETIAAALRFVPDGANLRAELVSAKIAEAVRPALASTEKPGRDATVTIVGGRPVVTPSVDGRGVDFDKTLVGAVDVLRRADNRSITAVYGDRPAKVTTEAINKLGITAVIGEFKTGGFARESGLNIRTAAAAINGTIVQPGETFSLNAATGDRSAATGYVEAGIIEDGHPSRGIGGGVSQLATTLYNASYFAGMTNVEHREHSFYISRYPVAREATVVQGALDVKFRNDNPTGLLIQTVWTPSSVTVRIYGTKRYDVRSTTGPRTNPTEPNEVVLPPGQPCTPSIGSPGFTATDTRTLREISTGKTRTETRTVTYKPAPKVICAPQ